MPDINQAISTGQRLNPLVDSTGGWRRWFQAIGEWFYDNQLEILVVCGVIIAVALAVRWWKKRSLTVSAPRPASAAAATASERPEISLKGTWKKFVSGLPREARSYATSFPHFLVFGEAGSGKSELVARYSDWQGMARQFLPSLTDDPNLQIYLGSNVVVQEFSPALLADTSDMARSALLSHWRGLYRFRDPEVVVVVSAEALLASSSEELRNQAQALRGKLNLLAGVRRSAVITHVAVTRMDKLEGFGPLTRLLARHNRSTGLTLSDKPGEGALAAWIEGLERWLPAALTTLGAEEYLQVLRFFHGADRLTHSLGQFLEALAADDPLAVSPRLRRIHFTSPQSPRFLGNPFSPEEPVALERAARTRRNRHIFAAVGLAVLCASPMLQVASSRYSAISDAEAALTSFSTAQDGRHLELAERSLRSLEAASAPAWLCAGCYRDQEEELRRRFVDSVRETILLQALRRHDADGATVRAVYTLGAIYAARGDALGALITEDTTHFSSVLKVPPTSLAAYVHFSREPWFGDVSLEGFHSVTDVVLDPELIERYLARLEEVMRRPVLDARMLRELQGTGGEVAPLLEELREFTQTRRLATLLGGLQRPGLARFLTRVSMRVSQDPWLEQNHVDLLELVQLVGSAELFVDVVPPGNLHELFDRFERLNPREVSEAPRVFRFELGGRLYGLRDVDWKTLVARSANQMLIERFVAEPRSRIWSPFFRDVTVYRPVEQRPSRSGLFGGSAVVEGIHTRDAFRAEVKDLLQGFDANLARYPIAEEGRQQLVEFVDEQAARYAENYADAWSRYYESFVLRPGSVSGLLSLLEELGRPNSPLDLFLRELALHTSVVTPSVAASAPGKPAADVGEVLSPYLEHLATELASFDSLTRVIGSSAGKGPIEEYKVILELMSAELLRTSQKGQEEQGSTQGLLGELSPAGRLAYQMLIEASDSYEGRVRTWLMSVGVRAPWDSVFLAPVEQLFTLGIRDVSALVASSWQARLEPMVSRAMARFPFRRGSSVEIPPAEVESLFGPQGEFWQIFREWVEPVVERRGGRWRARERGLTPVALPPNLLAVSNSLEDLRSRLWKDGEPQPLALAVKPLPLPRPTGDGWQVISSHMRVGQVAVKGFNQQPSWRTLDVPWWTSEDAQVAIVVNQGLDRTVVLSLEEPGSQWGLLRLLELGSREEGDVWVWRFEGQGGDMSPKSASFGIRSDEWSIFSRVGSGSDAWARSP